MASTSQTMHGLKCIFLNENVWISLKIPLKFVPRGPFNNIPALVQIMACRRPGDKPISESMLVFVPTYICVTRPQWVKIYLYKYIWNRLLVIVLLKLDQHGQQLDTFELIGDIGTYYEFIGNVSIHFQICKIHIEDVLTWLPLVCIPWVYNYSIPLW